MNLKTLHEFSDGTERITYKQLKHCHATLGMEMVEIQKVMSNMVKGSEKDLLEKRLLELVGKRIDLAEIMIMWKTNDLCYFRMKGQKEIFGEDFDE